MGIHQGVLAAVATRLNVVDPGGGQESIPNPTTGLWRRKYDGIPSFDDPNWFVTNAGLMTSEKATTQYIQTDAQDTTAIFSLQFKGYFCPTVSGEYKFRTQSDDGSWLWIGLPATDPTTQNALVNNGGAHGQVTVESFRAVKLTAGIYYPIRVHMWDSGGNWFLGTEYTIDYGLNWNADFSGQIFYNGVTYGF